MTPNQQRLADLMQRHGLSRKDLAKLINRNRGTVAKYFMSVNPRDIPEHVFDMIEGKETKPLAKKEYAIKTRFIDGVEYRVMSGSRLYANSCQYCDMYNKDGDYCSKPSAPCNTENRTVYFKEL